MDCNGNNGGDQAHSDEEQPTEGEEEKEEKKKKNIEINTTTATTTKRVLLEPNKRESTFQGIGSARNSYRQLNQVNHHITHKESEEGGEGNEEESRKTRKKKKKKPKSTSFKSTFIQVTSASPQPIPKKQQQPSQQSHRWQSFTTTNLLPKAVTTTAQSDGEVLSIRHSASPIHRKKRKKKEKEKNNAEDKGEEEEEEAGGRRKEEWVRPVWHKSTTATVTTPQQQIQRIGVVRENGMLEKKQQQQQKEREEKEGKEEQEEEDMKETKEVKKEEDEKQNMAEEERVTRHEEPKREDENGNEEARDKGGSGEASEKEGTKKRWSKERAATVGANNENELHLRIEEAHPRKAVSDILPFSPRTPPHHDNEEGREQEGREAEGEEEEEENADLKEITVLLRRRSAEERRRRIEEEVRKIKMELKQRERERRERKQFEREMEKRSSLARVDVRMMVGQHVEMIARSSERIDISVRRKKKEEAKLNEAEEEVKVGEEEEDMSKEETKQEEAAEETTETETKEHNKEGEREEKDDDDEEEEGEEQEDERRQRAKTMVAKKVRGTGSPLEAKLWRRSTARERKLERIDSFAHILHFLSADRLPILCGDNESESERERAAEQAEAKAREEAYASSASFPTQQQQQQQKQQQKHKKKKAKARREKEELKDADHDIAARSEEVEKETPVVCITKAEEAEQQQEKKAGAEEEEEESETYSYSDSSNSNSTSSSRINDNTGRFSSFSYSSNNSSSIEEEEKEDDDELMVHEGVERLFEGFTLSSAELQRIQRKLHTKEGRRLFTSSLQVQRTKARKELRSECFYQMEALMEAALVAAEQAADYRTAKHVMHLSTTFYRTVGTGWSSDEMQEYLQSALCLSRRVTICRELIFWQEIYYDSIQEERLQLLETMNHKAWQEQTQAEREDLIAWERNFLFGQLGSYSTLMLNFGVPFKDVIGFVEHQCDVNELTSSHRLSLTDHLISSKTMLEKEKEEREKKLTKEAWLKQRKEEWAQKQAQRYRRTVETKAEDPSVMELAGRSSLLPMPSRATSSPGPLRRNQQLTKSAKFPSSSSSPASSPSPSSSKDHWKEKRALSKSPRKKSPPFIPRLAGKTSREKKRDRHSPLSLSTPDISPSSSCSSSHEDLLSSSSYSSSSSENERDSTVATMLDQQRMSVERKRCLISIIQNLERKRMLPHLFSFLYFGWMGGRLRASIILPIADKAGALLKIHGNDRHHRHLSASSSPSSSSLSRSKACWRERTFALKDNFLMYFEKDGQQVARIFKLNVKWAVRVRCGYVERKTHRFVEEEEEEAAEGAAADHPQKETTEQQTKRSDDNDRRAEGEEEKEQRYCIQVWIDEDGQVPMILAAKTAKEQRKWYSALRQMTHWTLNPAIVIFADDDTESSSSSPSPSSSSVSFSFASRQQRKEEEEEDRKRFSGGDFVRTGTYSSHSTGRRQPQEEPKEENISLL
ncbi:hypothetical protein QOT17_003518 [Balamuthia mandrillaris]